jgi:DNA-binding transcriptional MerR regulator
MRIGTLAQATGLSRDTLRFYERQGLLQARRQANGYRDYPPEAVEWLGYIRTAQRLGFSLQEIAASLEDVERAADPDAYRRSCCATSSGSSRRASTNCRRCVGCSRQDWEKPVRCGGSRSRPTRPLLRAGLQQLIAIG